MPQKPNRLSRLWQELKRRHVIHVITVYATSSFVIIELVGNLAEPLNLPNNLQTIVIIVLAVGFPLAIILSWIYDLSSEGVEKTKPLSEIQEEEKRAVPNAWKIATFVSFVVIIGLVTFNIVRGTKGLRPGDIQSLAILPLENFTGDDQLEWVAGGMQSSLIGDMGKVSGLRVPGKTTSNAFKNTEMTATAIAKELNVDALVELTLSCYGEMVCTQVRVVTPYPEEKVIFVEDYMEDKSQILNLYNRRIKRVAYELKVNLTLQEETLLAESRTVDTAAYDAYLKGKFFWEKLDPESMQKSLDYFQLAINLDPEWADPYAGLAIAWGTFGLFGFLPKSVTLPNTYKFLNKALELDPNSSQAQYAKAINAVWQEWDWKQGENAFLKSLDLNPNHALCRLYYAHLLMILRRSEEAVHQANLGLELDPLKPLVLSLYGVVMRNEGEYQSSILHFEKALSIDPNFGFAAGNLRGTQFNLAYINGDYEKWFELWGEKVKGWWNDEGREAVLNTFREKGHIAGIEEMFRMNEKYGNEICLMDDEIKAERYIKLGDYEKAMDFVEKVYERRNVNTAYFMTNTGGYYSDLKDNPRYIEILKEMNLPLPEE